MDPNFTWPPSPGDQDDALEILQDTLRLIEDHDQDYEPRYALVLLAVSMAVTGGLEAGFAIDPAEPAWPVAYIELPTGQVSWHMPAHKTPFDGHSTPEKYERIRKYREIESQH
jgi:hypothetical protein